MDNFAYNTLKYASSLVLRTCYEVPESLHTKYSICNVCDSWGSQGGYQYPLHSSHSEQDSTALCQTSQREYLDPSARLWVTGNFQNTLRRETSWDSGIGSRNAQLDISNLHLNFAKHVQNASMYGVYILKGIVLWNSITCKGEMWVVVNRHRMDCWFREQNLVGQ